MNQHTASLTSAIKGVSFYNVGESDRHAFAIVSSTV